MRLTRKKSLIVLLAAAVLAIAGCSSGRQTSNAAANIDGGSPADVLRLGFFGNVTHAPALVAVGEGILARDLGSTKLETQVFNAGPAAIEALNAGAIDASYIGPNPAINAFVKSRGESLRIISGATSGGAQFVVRSDITSPADLKGANLASPQLGGTQDVALRSWLTKNGLENSVSGGGDVTITPTENAQTLQLFKQGKLDGAWMPEPWASRLVVDAGAKVLVDESTLWPEGKFLTTHLIVSTKFLQEHPQTVEALLTANLESIDWIKANTTKAEQVVNDQIARAAGKPLPPDVMDRAFTNIQVTVDPLASTLPKLLEDGVTAGTTKEASLDGIYDLRLLNKVLFANGQPTVSAAGIGEQ